MTKEEINDERSEEQALLMTYVSSLTDKEWARFRTTVSLLQHHPEVVALAFKMCEDLREELGQLFDHLPPKGDLH
jgi:hypothetical protein